MKKKKTKRKLPPVYLTIWQDAYTAIFKPKQYLRWALQPFSRTVTYLALINIVLTVVTTVFIVGVMRPELLLMADWLEDEVPEVIYEKSTLQIQDDKTFGFTDSDSLFLKVDPTITKEDEPRIDNFYEQGILLTSDQIVMSNLSESQVTDLSEIGLPDFRFSGEQLAGWIRSHSLWVSLVVLPPFIFAYYMLAKLLYSLFFSVLVYIASGFRHDLMRLWSMAIYALTPAIIAGHIAFVFAPAYALYTVVFLFYFLTAFMHYVRFLLKHTNLLKK